MADDAGAHERDPLQRLIDVAFYAPLGLMIVAQQELPNLIATGRARLGNQVALAQLLGKMAVGRGRSELKRRLDDAEQARRHRNDPAPAPSPVPVVLHDVPGPFTVATDEPVVLPDTVLLDTALLDIGDDAAPAGDLPVEGYDSLAASQVVLRLSTLTDDELEVVRRHEASHRARRTILGKISQLQAR